MHFLFQSLALKASDAPVSFYLKNLGKNASQYLKAHLINAMTRYLIGRLTCVITQVTSQC